MEETAKMAKPRRGGHESSSESMEPELEERPRQEQRLYLILDDYKFGYSIREISLSPPTSRLTRSSRKNTAATVQCLPQPIICLESHRGLPKLFAAVGTRILFFHCLNSLGSDDLLSPAVDVRSRGVTFGPANLFFNKPIFLPLGGELLALDDYICLKLSFNSLKPPPQGAISNIDYVPWFRQNLEPPPFLMEDVTSYAVLPDEQTVLFSLDCCSQDPEPGPVIFTMNTQEWKWERRGDWALPFTGRAYFVHCLNAFVGPSKDQNTLGQLAICDAIITYTADVRNVKLFNKDLAETHVSAKLINTGSSGGSEFCLVQCVKHNSGTHRYRLATFSLSNDKDGDLTTGKTCRVQCYRVPRETSKLFINTSDPVAFWL